MLLLWFALTANFLIGFFLGYKVRPLEDIERVAKSLKGKLVKQELGAVKRISPQELAKTDTEKEEEEAMEETFGKLL